MRKSECKPEVLGEIINDIINKPEYNELKKFDNIKKAWCEVCGDFISSNTIVRGFQNGVLLILAKASAFVFELNTLKKRYIASIRKALPSYGINDIFFKVGSAADFSQKAPDIVIDELLYRVKENEVMFYNIDNIEVPDDVKNGINLFIDSINYSDPELKQKAYNVSIIVYKVNQYKKRNGYIECKVCSGLFLDETKKSDICVYCSDRLKHSLKMNKTAILEKPWEGYETHSSFYPDISFLEYSYLKNREIDRLKKEMDELILQYVRSESADIFRIIDNKIRTALCLSQSRNYFEANDCGGEFLDLISKVLGQNVKAVYARGMFLSKM
ncbi:MAG: DUF721 domain-containing protein [Candidatus Wallbacteria bacterium]